MSTQQDLDDDLPAQPSPDVATFRPAFSTSFIVAAAIISLLIVFLILLLHIYAKLLWFRSSRSVFRRRGLASARAATPAAGLDAAAIAALPTFTYAAAPAEAGACAGGSSKAPLLECAVCISEFQGNEQGRTLPTCNHSFHTECIDMWLSSHTTCPLCRADVLRAATPAAAHHAIDGQEALGHPRDAEEEDAVAGSNPVQLPCNVLVWGDETHVNLQQEASSSSPSAIRPRAADSGGSRNRSLPQITITIPPMDGRVVLTIATPRQLSLSKADQAASSSSQPAPARSPGLGASLKRMLSRKSSGLTTIDSTHQP